MTNLEFNQVRIDAFREIGSIATGNAATSLSAMLGSKVNITVPNVTVELVEKVPELFGGREKILTAIFFKMSGQISGSILLVLNKSESLKLVNALTGQKVDEIENLDEVGLSALKELGNIIIGSFIRVLSNGLKMKMTYSVPGFSYDMVGAIFDEVLARLALETDHAVIMESEFLVIDKVYHGHLVFVLTPQAVAAVIKALGNL